MRREVACRSARFEKATTALRRLRVVHLASLEHYGRRARSSTGACCTRSGVRGSLSLMRAPSTTRRAELIARGGAVAGAVVGIVSLVQPALIAQLI